MPWAVPWGLQRWDQGWWWPPLHERHQRRGRAQQQRAARGGGGGIGGGGGGGGGGLLARLRHRQGRSFARDLRFRPIGGCVVLLALDFFVALVKRRFVRRGDVEVLVDGCRVG